MTIIDERGNRLPDGHPFKGMRNILGAKRPEAPPDAAPQQPAPSTEREAAQQSREPKSQA